MCIRFLIKTIPQDHIYFCRKAMKNGGSGVGITGDHSVLFGFFAHLATVRPTAIKLQPIATNAPPFSSAKRENRFNSAPKLTISTEGQDFLPSDTCWSLEVICYWFSVWTSLQSTCSPINIRKIYLVHKLGNESALFKMNSVQY